ncbi:MULTISPECIES: helix-turn-helix domain-containing protein [Mycobacterium]|jgi:transcriptional regulator with XRE-family HTH domain|uniref:DNA-binding helix-turn-helix protein n=4 Tax=Mycobacterium TaxID=1763 RepID=D5P597_9MYCO|nr:MULTISPECIES: helix-turn-helix transcriptional regulator [Mycobacterium]AGZ54648.1 XRE family transcriptional regulator [Mycobacterium kansasii ATCC 12478]ARV85462.1 transcriptional regulator [Mycobacterium intracellulare subsp. chimaera]ASL12473.1 bacteriophage protein [Mycobacterium intracellulare subsp. chimaera]ASL24161.1 bacteriophage protein [Mycobacterium intracellulare subsp. chimaera]ASX03692.1 transcriptional regulator [Mycobacterium intracellulare subsp. chimaera]
MTSDRLGVAVRLRRKQLKLTQSEVAERGGLSESTVRGVENNRLSQPHASTQRALERGLAWLPGSVEAILKGGAPRIQETGAPAAPADRDTATAAGDRLALAQRLIKMRQAFLEHRDTMPEAARARMDEEFSAASRETEEALIWMLAWLREDERDEAIRILAQLREFRP